MPMKNFHLTLEHAFYAIALTIAVGLRFLHLGSLPLSNFEAGWALQALRVSQGVRPALDPNPAYIHLTAILFYIFGATNFLARFWPAVAGAGLVLVPWSLRSRLGQNPALILAFGLALDPGLVAMSHLAGGPMLAITCLVLSGVMWLKGRNTAAGIFAGLAALSGASVWFGLLGLVLSWAFSTAFRKRIPSQTGAELETKESSEKITQPRWQGYQRTLASGFGTIIIIGSLCFLSPKGLPAFVMSFVESLRGWWTLSDVQAWRLLLALPAYEILPLGFGIAGAVRGIRNRNKIIISLTIWAFMGLLLAIMYPGKQTGDLSWALLPIWTLAALELGQHLNFEGCNLWGLAGVVVLVDSLLVFGWLNLAKVTTMDLGLDEARVRLYVLLAVTLLIGLSLLLVRAGWSGKIARLGGVWAGVFGLLAFTLAMSTGAGGLREPLTVELWPPEPRTGRVDVLLKVANKISNLNTGYDGQLPLTIVAVDSPALRWLFRDWQLQEVNALTPDATPEMVISSIDKLNLAANYRGEALPLSEVADWSHAKTSDWLKWFVYRQMPILRQEIILWVRSDLMLDNQGVPMP